MVLYTIPNTTLDSHLFCSLSAFSRPSMSSHSLFYQSLSSSSSSSVLLPRTLSLSPHKRKLFYFTTRQERISISPPVVHSNLLISFPFGGRQKLRAEKMRCLISKHHGDFFSDPLTNEDIENANKPLAWISASSCGAMTWLSSAQAAHSSEEIRINSVYEIGELFELGIQLSYLLLLLGLLGAGTFFVIRQVLVRRELDLSAKELQEQIRSGDANATELFELGAVMLRRKFYPAATKYLLQAISKWDGDDQDLAQVYNALGVSYIRDDKLDKGIAMFENAVKLQPG